MLKANCRSSGLYVDDGRPGLWWFLGEVSPSYKRLFCREHFFCYLVLLLQF